MKPRTKSQDPLRTRGSANANANTKLGRAPPRRLRDYTKNDKTMPRARLMLRSGLWGTELRFVWEMLLGGCMARVGFEVWEFVRERRGW